jgi:hypothetical protein
LANMLKVKCLRFVFWRKYFYPTCRSNNLLVIHTQLNRSFNVYECTPLMSSGYRSFLISILGRTLTLKWSLKLSVHCDMFKCTKYLVIRLSSHRQKLFFNSLSGGWSPTGSTRHGGHWLAYSSLPRVIMMMENFVEWRLARETDVLRENPPSATLSTINPTWPDPGSNPGRRGEKPATNRLSHGAAI